MPIYEYRCDNGHTFEVVQRMTDDPLSSCQTCSAPVQRVFHPIAVHFKGSGFYNTDYGTRKREREKAASTKSDGDGAKSSEGAKSGEGAKSTDAKAGDKKSTAGGSSSSTKSGGSS